ncbi:Uu.00g116690.m01.CDS01 [Anthostomella pinea]|uniref:Uu.00g116690.m01.CDS01 n=1 Tax=Anthostomella pinea TaxID=933095 RepID=A0AAI8YGS1_9PEZI|nr:Uu.00g116690.m01.CDS01 [Anthostomella pinea]
MAFTSRSLIAVLAAATTWSLPAAARPNPTPCPGAGASTRAEPLDIRDTTDIAVNIPSVLTESTLYGAPPNDFTCKSARNPVVLLHGLSADREVDLNLLQRELSTPERGYCTFSATYGAWPLTPWIGGLTDMTESARDIAAFIREVKEKTGADKVDVVGHSEGGVQALYVPLSQPGIAALVDHVVALGPAVHGADYFGFTDLWYVGGDATRALAKPFSELIFCPACEQMMPDGAITDAFDAATAAGGIKQEGNNVTVIMSRSDKLVTPDVSEIDEAGVRNVFVQDTCPDDRVGHAGLAWDKSVWRLVINALEKNDDVVFECEEGLEI